MADTHFRVNTALHQRMKDIATQNSRSLIEEYEIAIRNHLKEEVQKGIVANSELESFINQKINALDNHLASMMARTGMDTSMNLMAMIMFLEKFFNGKYTREELQDQLRRDGARYFSTAIKKDRDEKKKP